MTDRGGTRRPPRFRDRVHAGRNLAERLRARAWVDPVVAALPRGGVPVAFEVALVLGAPLDVAVSRKVGAPDHPEWGIGAVGEGAAMVADQESMAAAGVSEQQFTHLAGLELQEVGRRVARYRGSRPPVDITGRDVIVVDDGVATGVTAEAALRDLAGRLPRSVTMAAPVCSPAAARRLGEVADEVVCLAQPEPFRAVGAWYRRFDQTPDREVVALLERARSRMEDERR